MKNCQGVFKSESPSLEQFKASVNEALGDVI